MKNNLKLTSTDIFCSIFSILPETICVCFFLTFTDFKFKEISTLTLIFFITMFRIKLVELKSEKIEDNKN